jgi:hypothetical protein
VGTDGSEQRLRGGLDKLADGDGELVPLLRVCEDGHHEPGVARERARVQREQQQGEELAQAGGGGR